MAKKSGVMSDEEYLERFKVGTSEDYTAEEWQELVEDWGEEEDDEQG